MSRLVKEVYTKCAECGGTARLKFDVCFEPWRYVAVCDNCKQHGEPGTTQCEAIDAWDRRQKEKMAERKKREYLVVATRKYGAPTEIHEFDCVEHAISHAQQTLKGSAIVDVYVAKTIAKTQMTRQLVFVEGDDEC